MLQWLAAAEHELLLFAAIWFAVFALDEMLVDLAWLRLRFSGGLRTERLLAPAQAELRGMAAVLVPAWQEAGVIGDMVRHSFQSWPQRNLRIYVGCYRNDEATLAALVASGGDHRLRVVLHDCDGPTTKADCLNRLYRAICEDERRSRQQVRALILHDAEDMVHPSALTLMDRELDRVDFVQLPVRPEPQAASRWVAGHYCDEFAEAHARDMVVRDRIGAALPAAGVGCAFSRRAIDRIIAQRGSVDPFAADCLTEDYECGLLVNQTGGRSTFLRVRDESGGLIATREFFPATIAASVRQKTRWIHGIAFQGWDRLGWRVGPGDLWMRLRDRRGPLVALVLTVAYLMLLLWPMMLVLEAAGLVERVPSSPLLRGLLVFNLASLLWRLAMRAMHSGREYGWTEGARALVRFPVGNVIAIMATQRALVAYVRVLSGQRLRWEHTVHRVHVVTACGGEDHSGAALPSAA
ncbi:glycosyl transferase family protein [Novosphingobium sp. 17-62-19]|uniref:glycosyl transferase family protein n=1 Tax=Novosphingobium sp. 17-62-19 TaxID=1970406 RepID=UPI00344B018C